MAGNWGRLKTLRSFSPHIPVNALIVKGRCGLHHHAGNIIVFCIFSVFIIIFFLMLKNKKSTSFPTTVNAITAS